VKSARRLTGVVKANDTIVGRIPLFSIALTKAPTVQPESGGFPIGTALIVGRFRDYDG
jgi:hypothetical protein